MVDPNQSDLGLAFNFQNSLLEEIRDTTEKKLLDRQENTPIKSLATHSGQIQTPGSFLKSYTESALKTSSDKDVDPKYTGRIFADLADVAGTFLDTFLNKSQDLLFNPKKGLLAKTEDPDVIVSIGKRSSISDERGAPRFVTEATTQARIAELAEIRLGNPGTLDLLAQLQSTNCDVQPNSCVITSKFAQAIQQRMTLQEAVDKKIGIEEKTKFGFTSASGGQPSLEEGLPYRSLVILRKYRVIPVGWELAALYIKQHPQGACGSSNDCTLGHLMEKFNDPESPFYRLVDPAWILKLPAVYCAVKGFGPSSKLDQITFQCLDTNGDGRTCCKDECDESIVRPVGATDDIKYDRLVQVDPRSEICLDEKTCLEDDQSGKCKEGRYGYCLEEKKSWTIPDNAQCEQQYASCQLFTAKDTGKSMTLIQDSILGLRGPLEDRVCAQNNSGCAVYSKKLIPAASATSTPLYVWSESAVAPNDDQVYLASSATACSSEAEGCRQVDDNNIFMRLAPDYYGCQMNSVTLKPYQKKECKKFALSCTTGYGGCESYQPEDGTSGIAGKDPTSCNEKCAGYQQFSMMKTDFEPATSTSFIAQAPAKFCPAQEAGCDEFTNLDITSGEKREYFKRGQRCEKPTENTPSHAIFYSWYGSDTGGQKLEKYTLKFIDTTTLACIGAELDCKCNPSSSGESKGTCQKKGYREFINQSGAVLPLYYRRDQLIIVADDCHPYRRTLSGPSADSLSISPSYSERCSSQFAGCREYTKPEAGNYQVVFNDTFADKNFGSWFSGEKTDLDTSSETQILNDNSLQAKRNDASVDTSMKRFISVTKGLTYTLSFVMKTDPGATIQATVIDNRDQSPVLNFSRVQEGHNSTLLNNTTAEWQFIKFQAVATNDVPDDKALLRIAVNKNEFFIDTISLKQIEGIVYIVKNSWDTPSVCDNTTLDCRAYTKSDGKQIALTAVGTLCPVEMVGCKEFKKGTQSLWLVDDPAKKCSASENQCTAYGTKMYDRTKKADIYHTVYYKIAPENIPIAQKTGVREDLTIADRSAGVCHQEELGCKRYDLSGGETYFKDPDGKYCAWEEKDGSNPAGWYAKHCGGDISKKVCSALKDCSVGEECKPVLCPINQGYVKQCPTKAIGCRKIIDPECVDNGAGKFTLRKDYGRNVQGLSCTPAYFALGRVFKDKVDECGGLVNSDKGCILVNDSESRDSKTWYNSDSLYNEYATDKQAAAVSGAAFPGVSLNAVTAITSTQSGYDSNRLIKLQADRQCKTWLECTSYEESESGSIVCRESRPCDERNEDGTCKEIKRKKIDLESRFPQLRATVTTFSAGGTKSDYLMLSGLSRPDFVFNTKQTTNPPQEIRTYGGHDAYFSWDPVSGACRLDETIQCVKDSECGNKGPCMASGLKSLLTMKEGDVYNQKNLPRSCRVHAAANVPAYMKDINRNTVRPENECRYKTRGGSVTYPGIYGYCLEPYPDQDLKDGQNRTFANMYQTDILAGKSYNAYCLNWMPVDRTFGEPAVVGIDQPHQGLKIATNNVDYCTKQSEFPYTESIPEEPQPLTYEFKPEIWGDTNDNNPDGGEKGDYLGWSWTDGPNDYPLVTRVAGSDKHNLYRNRFPDTQLNMESLGIKIYDPAIGSDRTPVWDDVKSITFNIEGIEGSFGAQHMLFLYPERYESLSSLKSPHTVDASNAFSFLYKHDDTSDNGVGTWIRKTPLGQEPFWEWLPYAHDNPSSAQEVFSDNNRKPCKEEDSQKDWGAWLALRFKQNNGDVKKIDIDWVFCYGIRHQIKSNQSIYPQNYIDQLNSWLDYGGEDWGRMMQKRLKLRITNITFKSKKKKHTYAFCSEKYRVIKDGKGIAKLKVDAAPSDLPPEISNADELGTSIAAVKYDDATDQKLDGKVINGSTLESSYRGLDGSLADIQSIYPRYYEHHIVPNPTSPVSSTAQGEEISGETPFTYCQASTPPGKYMYVVTVKDNEGRIIRKDRRMCVKFNEATPGGEHVIENSKVSLNQGKTPEIQSVNTQAGNFDIEIVQRQLHTIRVKFHSKINSDVSDGQEPLRKVMVEWNDGSIPSGYGFDTTGPLYKVTGDDNTEAPKSKPRGGTQGFHNEVHSYDTNPEGKIVCVTLIDNWYRGVKQCTTLQKVNNRIQPGTYTTTPLFEPPY